MNKEKVLKMIKEDLRPLIDRLDLITLQDDLGYIKSHVKMLESLSALDLLDHQNQPDTIKTVHLEQNEAAEIPQKITVHEKPNSLPTKDLLKQKSVYVFERKLKGGYIQKIDAYVPETTVRQLSLNEGDLIRAVPIGKKDGKKMYYDFDLVKKIRHHDPNRKEIKYCVVKNDGFVWFSNQTLSGENIKLEDMPFTIRIRDTDARDFQLSEGDIVDMAYYEDHPVSSKVVWKHRIEDDDYSAPLPHGAYKDKTTDSEEIQEHPVLRGKIVTLIGCIDRQAAYRDRLTALGAEFQAMDGTEDEHRISALIQRSDLVVIIIPQISHGGMSTAKKYCKTHDIPFITVDSIGTTSVVNSAINLAQHVKVKIES